MVSSALIFRPAARSQELLTTLAPYSRMLAPSPLRIVHVFRAPVGGLFRHVADLASAQTASGHQVGIVCDASTGGSYEDAILASLAKTLPLGLTRIAMPRQMSPADLWVTGKVWRHLRNLSPDVIHGHGAKGGVYARLAGAMPGQLRHTARVYTPHGGSLHYDPASLTGRIYFAAERFLGRYTDALIHVCQFEADTYRRKVGVPRCMVRVIPNGLNQDEFVPVEPRADARDLLFLGAFRELKGIDVLLNAIAKLQTKTACASARVLSASRKAAPPTRKWPPGSASPTASRSTIQCGRVTLLRRRAR